MFSITFTGTKIALIGALAPHHGIASVALDAAPAVDADLYAATRAESAPWWTSPTLAAGQHTVVVTVTGRKNAASVGTVVSIDRVDLTDGALVVPTPVPTPTPTPAPTPTPTPLPGQALRPAYNTGTGFFVVGKKLYDANGYEFRIRGVNKLHTGSTPYDAVDRMKANTVRWIMSDPVNSQPAQVTAANAWIAQKIVPIPGNWDGTCKNDAASLTAVVDLWVANAALWITSDLQKYAIINIANEWGPSNSVVWRDSYITAISRMRAAGYRQTLMIDTGGCGQDVADLLQYAQVVFDSDPQKNIIFGQHIYGQWSSTPANWQTNFATGMQQLGALSVPVVIGEFGPGRNIGPSPTLLTPREVMQAAENQGLGWLAWAVDDNNLPSAKSDDLWFSMLYNNFVFNTSADLTIFGKVVVDDPTYGLKAIAVKAAALTGIPL